MIRKLGVALLGVAIAAGLSACEEERTLTAPDDLQPVLKHKPGHGGGGGGGGGPGGGDPPVPVDLSGGMITTDEPAVVVSDNKKKLTLSAPTDCPGGADCFNVELSLASLAGNPTPTDLGGCVIDPPDMDAGVLSRLISHLDDPAQGRQFGVNIDKRKGTGSIGAGAWTDDDGNRYAANLSTNIRLPQFEVSVAEGPTDVWTFNGGAVRIRTPMPGGGAVDAYLVCENLGSIELDMRQ